MTMKKGKAAPPILFHTNSKPAVRVGPLMAMPRILEELGSDPGSVFREAGFELSQFRDPDNEIPFIQGSRLIERCVEVTGCKHFGLLLGGSADPSSLGIAGFMLRVAPHVDSALLGLVRHLDLHDQGGMPTLERGKKRTRLGYQIHLSGVHARDQILDMSLAVICNILRGICGPEWKPARVLAGRPVPEDHTPYEQFFQAPVEYGSQQNAVEFSSKWLSHSLESADPLLLQFLEQQAAGLHAQKSLDMLGGLRQFINLSLATGQCTASAAARHLGMHERTLNRHLGKAGTSFRQVLAQIRYEKARELLSSSKMTHSEIAWVLGYSDATAFNRSFKRWSGMAPEKWRCENG